MPTDWAGHPVRPSTTTAAAATTLAPTATDSRAASAEAEADGGGGCLCVVIIAAIVLLLTIAGAVLFVRSKLAELEPATYSGTFVNQCSRPAVCAVQ